MTQIKSTAVCLAGQQSARANGLRHASYASRAISERLYVRRSMIHRLQTAPASASGGSAGSNGGDELPPAASSSGLTTEEAYSYLGLEAGASYEDVLAAKNQMLER